MININFQRVHFPKFSSIFKHVILSMFCTCTVCNVINQFYTYSIFIIHEFCRVSWGNQLEKSKGKIITTGGLQKSL